MSIQNIIIHEVRREGTEDAEVFPRSEENHVDDHAEYLSSQLSGLFRKTGLSTGGFRVPEGDEQAPQFVELLKRYFDRTQFNGFVNFSQSATSEFERLLNDSTGKGGYLLFNHYTYDDKKFLTVVLLRKKIGLSITEGNVLSQIKEIDLDKLHMAARINLSDWLSGSTERYIAFRIGGRAKDITNYFSKFIGCETHIRDGADTRNLVQVTKAFCNHHEFSDDVTEDVKSFVYETCVDWSRSDEPVVRLDSLSSLLDERFQTEDQGVFLDIAQGEQFGLSNQFPINKTRLKELVRYQGRTSKVSLSFASELLDETVFYNSQRGELTFTELPVRLKDELDEYAQTQDQDQSSHE